MRRRGLWAAMGGAILALLAACKERLARIGWGAGTR